MECAPESPCGRGSLGSCVGGGFLPSFGVFFAFPFAPLEGDDKLLYKPSTGRRPVRPMVMRDPTSYLIAAGDCENGSL